MFVPCPVVMPSHLRKEDNNPYTSEYSYLLREVDKIQCDLSRQYDVKFKIPLVYDGKLEIGYFQNNIKRGIAFNCSDFEECIGKVKKFYSTILHTE